MKAIFINGSPRKNKNTAQMLESAMRGAQEAGAEVEMIHLYGLNYKGCMSCFLCKRKGNTANGLCGFKDELQPVLENVINADVRVDRSRCYYPAGCDGGRECGRSNCSSSHQRCTCQCHRWWQSCQTD